MGNPPYGLATGWYRALVSNVRAEAADLSDQSSSPPETSLARAGFGVVKELVGLHPLPFTIAVTGALIYAAATVGSTIVLGRATDRVIFPTFEEGQVPRGSLVWVAAAIVAIAVLRSSGVVARRYFAGMTSERGQRTLRHRLLDRYTDLPLAWHQQTPAGRLLAHADNDTEITTEMLHPLPFSLGVAFLAVFSSISLVVIDVWLALVAFLIFPALTMLNQVYSNHIEGPAARAQAAVGRVSSIAHESFDGALIVKTLGRADTEGRRFAGAAEQLRTQRVQVGFIRALFESILEALPNLGIVFVVIFGAYRIDAGAITRGDLVQVASLFVVLALPMRVLGFFLEMVPPSVVARRRLDMVFDEPVPPQPAEPMQLAAGPLGLRVRDVHFQYPGLGSGKSNEEVANADVDAEAGQEPSPPTHVLHGVDFTVQPGEVVALVGSTGSGKSTLCSLIAGLIPADRGEIEIGGVPIAAIDPPVLAGAVALVFQESFLFADTLRANVDLGRLDAIDGPRADQLLEQAGSVAQVVEFLGDLPSGWQAVVGERGVTLSGGQRQRVALARALVGQPRFLLLDDATSAVDPKIERRILDGLRGGATTTLIVAQRLSTITLADRVLYLADGRIAGQGPHSDLMSIGGYRALVEAYEVAGQ